MENSHAQDKKSKQTPAVVQSSLEREMHACNVFHEVKSAIRVSMPNLLAEHANVAGSLCFYSSQGVGRQVIVVGMNNRMSAVRHLSVLCAEETWQRCKSLECDAAHHVYALKQEVDPVSGELVFHVILTMSAHEKISEWFGLTIA